MKLLGVTKDPIGYRILARRLARELARPDALRAAVANDPGSLAHAVRLLRWWGAGTRAHRSRGAAIARTRVANGGARTAPRVRTASPRAEAAVSSSPRKPFGVWMLLQDGSPWNFCRERSLADALLIARTLRLSDEHLDRPLLPHAHSRVWIAAPAPAGLATVSNSR